MACGRGTQDGARCCIVPARARNGKWGCCAEFVSQSRRQFAISHLRCNAFGTPAIFAHFHLPTPPPRPPSPSSSSSPPDAPAVPLPRPPPRLHHAPHTVSSIPALHRPISPAHQHGCWPSRIDVPPHRRLSAFLRPVMGGRQDVCRPLSLPISLPAHPSLPPGSIFTYTTTAINVASAKPPASSSQKPRYHQTRPPQSTPNRASCSSPFHAFSCRLISISTCSSLSGGGVSFGCFSQPRAMAKERRTLWSTPRYVTDYRPTSSPRQRIPSPAPAPNTTG